MDERNYGAENNTGEAWTNPAPVEENNAPAPAPAVEETKKKSLKDFTPEEVKVIFERAKKVDLSRVANEFNTTWQTVMTIKKQNDPHYKPKAPAKPKAVKKPPVKSSKGKKTSDFTLKEKKEILARAKAEGFRTVAAAVGTNWQTLAAWNKQLSEPESAASAAKASNAKPASKPVAAAKPAKLSGSESLELENAILKEKLSLLTQQVEKLRAAVGSLA